MRRISDRRLWDEIADRGAPWGIFPTNDVRGSRGERLNLGTMAAESFLVQRRIAPGIAAVVPVTRIICRVDTNNRLQNIIRLRRGRGERGLRKRISVMMDVRQRKKAHLNDDFLHEFGADFRRLVRRASQVWLGG